MEQRKIKAGDEGQDRGRDQPGLQPVGQPQKASGIGKAMHGPFLIHSMRGE